MHLHSFFTYFHAPKLLAIQQALLALVTVACTYLAHELESVFIIMIIITVAVI